MQNPAVALFCLGLLVGGSVSAVVLWLLSGLTQPIPQWARYAVVLIFAAAAVLRDLGLLRFWVPQNARQVPQDVLRRNILGGALQFGFEMGTGVRTYVSATAPYAVALALLLAEVGFVAALLTGVGFGIGRAVTFLLRFAAQMPIDVWDHRVAARLPWLVPGSTATVLATLAVVLLI
jgi:hypothetical protein